MFLKAKIFFMGRSKMAYNTVLVDQKEYVGVITLNRPEAMNTFSTEMAKELNQALIALDNDPGIRVVVVKGAGKAFSVGIDVSEFFGKSQKEYREWVGLMEQMNHVIGKMKKPVIASVHGFAVANGAGLMAAADLAVIAEGTKIGTTAINVGLICLGPAVPLARIVGRKKTLEMVLTGDFISAAEAQRLGLVNQVVPPEELENATMALALKLAAKSPRALQVGKQGIYGMMDLPYHQSLDYLGELFASLCVTEDAREGLQAFEEKRKPVWKNR